MLDLPTPKPQRPERQWENNDRNFKKMLFTAFPFPFF
jgi:hypothetical protein